MPPRDPVGKIRNPYDQVKYAEVVRFVKLWDHGHGGYLWDSSQCGYKYSARR